MCSINHKPTCSTDVTVFKPQALIAKTMYFFLEYKKGSAMKKILTFLFQTLIFKSGLEVNSLVCLKVNL